MYTVTFNGPGEIIMEKPRKSISIRHIDGDVQVTQSEKDTNYKKEIILEKYKGVYLDDLDKGTIFAFAGTAPFTVECELS